MSNPLIEKFYELHPEKKEKPKLPRIKDIRFAQEYECEFIKAENAKVAIKSYDPDSARDSFLQIAEKIKNNNAKVTSVSINADTAGGFYTGLKTYTFEVMEWDTP